LTALSLYKHTDYYGSPHIATQYLPLVSHKVWWDGVGANGRWQNPQGVPLLEVGSHNNLKIVFVDLPRSPEIRWKIEISPPLTVRIGVNGS
jgi:hypothetical protein